MTERQDRAQAHARLWELIKDIRVAMLTTREDDRLRSRPMHGFQEALEDELWFFTRLDSAKAREVLLHPGVNLAYADQHEKIYVSVSGRGELVTDRQVMERYWNPMVAAWFPDGLDDPDLALIKVVVEEAEYWDAETGAMRYFWEVTTARIEGRQPDVGEHGQVTARR
ncbi:pyridoxamine 5'-phosphate oxidase family protein [Geminicoccaceae bacterium 1502E]|nr:pyridoxamine 5'-phosphate oxidase family protein [Geminicoccaceae bacterium 1502E]